MLDPFAHLTQPPTRPPLFHISSFSVTLVSVTLREREKETKRKTNPTQTFLFVYESLGMETGKVAESRVRDPGTLEMGFVCRI